MSNKKHTWQEVIVKKFLGIKFYTKSTLITSNENEVRPEMMAPDKNKELKNDKKRT